SWRPYGVLRPSGGEKCRLDALPAGSGAMPRVNRRVSSRWPSHACLHRAGASLRSMMGNAS
ncbi:MAG: hypothetical protein OXH92_09575, partial [Bryobacterales bacterium]|nr:hypothetical protein [Bryobacterales bacterium]